MKAHIVDTEQKLMQAMLLDVEVTAYGVSKSDVIEAFVEAQEEIGKLSTLPVKRSSGMFASSMPFDESVSFLTAEESRANTNSESLLKHIEEAVIGAEKAAKSVERLVENGDTLSKAVVKKNVLLESV